MAKKLAELNIPTTLISDAAVFAMMPKINKVILGTRSHLSSAIATNSIMANGGIVNSMGAHMIAIAAKAYVKPVIVVSGIFKLTPVYGFDSDTYNYLQSPMSIYTPRNEENQDNIEVFVPSYDYVPPELISLYITDQGPQTPNYVYRMLAEMYSHEDYNLEKQ